MNSKTLITLLTGAGISLASEDARAESLIECFEDFKTEKPSLVIFDIVEPYENIQRVNGSCGNGSRSSNGGC